jgi:hypothetical protein
MAGSRGIRNSTGNLIAALTARARNFRITSGKNNGKRNHGAADLLAMGRGAIASWAGTSRAYFPMVITGWRNRYNPIGRRTRKSSLRRSAQEISSSLHS